MKKIFFLSTLVLVLVQCCHANYIGAVVEYNSGSSSSPNLTIEENLKNYIYQVELARNFNVQIIVFPEYGLTGLVDNPVGFAIVVPEVGTSDFTNENYFLLKLSNAANEHSLHIVVNLLEQASNAENHTIYYNTNLVFSSNGTLIARYRKINLYKEPNLTPGNETVTFTTDFGTFGLITCMDILYYNPSQSILANSSGVTDVVYPAAWNSYLPFYMSLDVQVGYALANRVNLLAANINDPTNGRGGSGIYRNDGTILRTILTDVPATSSVSAHIVTTSAVTGSFDLMGFDILRNDTRQELVNYKNRTDFQYDYYIFKSLDLTQENITEEICDGSFCCNFNIVALRNETNSSDVYKLVAFSGHAKFDTVEVGLELCSLVACLNDDIASCGVRPPAPYNTIFREILVWGNFETQPEDFFRPSSLTGNLLPVFNVTYLESRTNESYGVSYNITRPISNVVQFGLYGRSGVESLSISLIFVAILVVAQGLF